jgi:hypothetical protein
MVPASSPSSKGENLHNGEAPMVRKLGKHQPKVVVSSYDAVPGLNPCYLGLDDCFQHYHRMGFHYLVDAMRGILGEPSQD